MQSERNIVGQMLDLLGGDWTDRRAAPSVTTLAAPCAADDTDITVMDSRVMQVYAVLKIDQELLLVTRTLDPLMVVTRGFGETTAAPHEAGAAVHIVGVALPQGEVA